MPFKILRRITMLVVLVCHSFNVYAYTPNIQAALFNAALTETPIIQQQRLIQNTALLYKTLNAEETISLVSHEYLKAASYMFLVEFWQGYSLDRILRERGVALSNETLKELDISEQTFNVPLGKVGPLNLVFNTSELTNKQCTRSKNQPFLVSYDQLYNTIIKLQRYLSKQDEVAASTAMLYIKAYFYLRFHSPNATYTYANNDCISDVNGLLTCADNLLNDEDTSSANLERVRRYMELDLNSLKLNKKTRERLEQCSLTVWHFLQSSAASEPLNDGAIIAASQALMSEASYNLKKRARESTSFKSILSDTREIMMFVYYPEKFPVKKGFDRKKLIKPLLINQMKLASLRLSAILESEEMLNGN